MSADPHPLIGLDADFLATHAKKQRLLTQVVTANDDRVAELWVGKG